MLNLLNLFSTSKKIIICVSYISIYSHNFIFSPEGASFECVWTLCMLCAQSQLWLLVALWMRDAHNVLSSIALLSSCRLMPMVSFESIHFILVFLYFLLPSIIPSTDFFSQRTLFSNDEPQIGQFQFCHFFCLHGCFRLNLP